MDEIPGNCPMCEETPTMMTFVDYLPEPNDHQIDAEWVDDLPALKAIVCAECGHVMMVNRAPNPGCRGGEPPSSGSGFRVDGDLQ